MRPLPELTAENTAYWKGGADGALMIVFCDDCDHAIHPPQRVCSSCLSQNVSPRAVSGTGVVYTYTVNHQPWTPDMSVPFALAVVDVDGAPGVRVTAEVVGMAAQDVAIGQRMRVRFQQVDDVWLPEWEPAP